MAALKIKIKHLWRNNLPGKSLPTTLLLSLIARLEMVIPGSCYHKESEAKLTAAVTKMLNRDSRRKVGFKSGFIKICAEVQGLVL